MSEPSSSREPTYLRDARLKHALDHAPDAHLQAPKELQNAIKNIAASALQTGEVATFPSKSGLENSVSGSLQRPLQTGAEKPFRITQLGTWMQSLWRGAGQQNKPWNAAFATLVLGSIITLIWFDKDVPDAAPDERSASAAPATQKPPVLAAPAATDAPDARAAPTAVTPNMTTASGDELTSASKSLPAPIVNKKSVVISTPADAEKSTLPAPPAALQDAAKSTGAIASEANGAKRDLARSDNTAMQDKAEIKAEPAVVELPAAPAAAVAAAPALRAAATTTLQLPVAPAPATATASPRGATAALAEKSLAKSSVVAAWNLGDWRQADVSYLGRIARLARADAQSLVSQAEALAVSNAAVGAAGASNAATGDVSGGASGIPLLQLHLLDASGVVAQFELWNNTYRWRRKGLADVAGRLTQDQLTALLAQVSRSLPP